MKTGQRRLSVLLSIEILKGTGEQQFSPNAVTSGIFVTALGRMMNVDTNGLDFVDEDKIADWAREDVYSMKEHTILGGKGNENFAPQGYAMRAEVCAMLEKYINSVMSTEQFTKPLISMP